ncbi:MAG: Phospholipase D/Transphosphatidylase [Rhodocyclales bacterium]|nr:Phospholipase D/Transphosphatidylase [Rhodocyclales bacterium]
MFGIETPASPKAWAAIAKRAQQNTAAYEAVFDWIPRNESIFATPEDKKIPPSSIWPRWKKGISDVEQPVGYMPFQNEFWSVAQHKASSALLGVKGFIAALPTKWMEGENNNWGYHSALISKIDDVPEPQDQRAKKILLGEASPLHTPRGNV